MKDWTIKALPLEVVNITREAARRNGMMINAWVSRALSAAAAADEEAGPVTPQPEILRHEMAKAALAGMLSHPKRYIPRAEDAGLHWHNAISREAYQIADAMLAEGVKPQ